MWTCPKWVLFPHDVWETGVAFWWTPCVAQPRLDIYPDICLYVISGYDAFFSFWFGLVWIWFDLVWFFTDFVLIWIDLIQWYKIEELCQYFFISNRKWYFCFNTFKIQTNLNKTERISENFKCETTDESEKTPIG